MKFLDIAVIIAYFVIMAGIGFCFARKNQNTDSYFKAGGRLPWWAVAMSIYATMFSSITFISMPAISFSSDMRYFILSFGIILMAPIVVKWYLPRFRALNLTCAYEYLETRFNLPCRLFASGAFILFMIARSSIVAYLPALAIASVTGIDINHAITAVVLVTIVYCAVGGIEAVIWSDFVQSIILIGATAFILTWAICGTDGGFTGFIAAGEAADKFRIFDFSSEWAAPCFYVALIGGIVANFASYTSDQCVIQRYMTTPDEKSAAKSILFNGSLSVINFFVFFCIGVALWTFYHSHPEALPSDVKPDAVLPFFIVRELPSGISGLVIAAVAAATMSTLSSNLNSAASAITEDFYKRLFAAKNTSDRKLLLCGKASTVAVGILGGAMALWLANGEINNIYAEFQRYLGILTGGLGALFFMGFFMKRVNGTGAIWGLAANYLVCIGLDVLPVAGKPHLLLYGFFGMLTCLIVAPIASLLKRGSK